MSRTALIAFCGLLTLQAGAQGGDSAGAGPGDLSASPVLVEEAGVDSNPGG